ncbi:MAG: hypothetical protein WD577_11460 [Bacteroidales bacterium]
MLNEFKVYAMMLTTDDKLESSRGEGADEWARYCFIGPFLHAVNMLSMYESVIRYD